MDQHTHAGRIVTLGKEPARYDKRNLKLAKYVSNRDTLPEPAAARDLTTGLPQVFEMFGNDVNPICTMTALGHKIALLQQLNGLPVTVTTRGVIDAYCAYKGIERSELPFDGGTNMLDVMKWVRKNGLCGVKILAFMEFNPQDRLLTRLVVDLFGGPYLGLALPTTAQSQDVWDAVPGMIPGSWGGHAVSGVSDSPKLDCYITWAMKKPVTPEFVGGCADEAYALLFEGLPPPAGLDMDALLADLALL